MRKLTFYRTDFSVATALLHDMNHSLSVEASISFNGREYLITAEDQSVPTAFNVRAWRISNKIGVDEPLVFEDTFSNATDALKACKQENGVKRLVQITPIFSESQFNKYNKQLNVKYLDEEQYKSEYELNMFKWCEQFKSD